jgi:heme ABC exporter ATP-binding subunit CcmA
MIQLDHVFKKIGYQTVLSDIHLTISAGEYVPLVGANGAGKTTLLRLLATLSRPSQGKLQIGGFVLPQHAARVRGMIAYLGHEISLYDHLTAVENIRFFFSIYRRPASERQITEMLAEVGISHRALDEVRTFSRGMKQRLQLLLCLMGDADLLLLDEPYSCLDEAGSLFLHEKLKTLHQAGKTILLVTHDTSSLHGTVKRVLRLQHGTASWTSLADLSSPAGELSGAA